MSAASRASHPYEHEEFLERALAGDASASEEEARVGSCPVCRDELERIRRLAASLDRIGSEQRADVESSISAAGPNEAALMRRAYLERISALEAKRRRPVRFFVLGAVAAAILLAVLLGRWLSPTPPESPARSGEIYLGGERIAPLEPVGDVPAYSRFAWRAELFPGASYHLVVREGTSDGPVLHQELLTASEWIPTPERAASLPPSIYWEVRLLDAAGNPVDSCWALAWR